MTAIILGVLAGVLLYAYHKERLKEVGNRPFFGEDCYTL